MANRALQMEYTIFFIVTFVSWTLKPALSICNKCAWFISKRFCSPQEGTCSMSVVLNIYHSLACWWNHHWTGGISESSYGIVIASELNEIQRTLSVSILWCVSYNIHRSSCRNETTVALIQLWVWPYKSLWV